MTKCYLKSPYFQKILSLHYNQDFIINFCDVTKYQGFIITKV